MLVNRGNTVLWNVDTQFDFIDPDGKLYVEGAEEIKPTLTTITEFGESNKIRVVNTMDWHYEDSEELSDDPDFAETFPPHCMADSKGVEFIKETDPEEPYIIDWSINLGLKYLPPVRNLIIRKDKFDVFDGNPNTNRIVDILKRGGTEVAIVYGVTADICVSFAINGLLERGLRVVLLKDGTKPLNESSFENLLGIWEKNNNFQYLEFEDLSIT
jgi:nicotinamidase/pyrazinamidase